ALAPCFIWGVDEKTFRETRAFADQFGLPIHIHTSETEFEVEFSLSRYGKRDLEYMESIGFLGPDVVAVHCVNMTDRDLRILKHYDVKVSHNPVTNMYLASGVPRIPE